MSSIPWLYITILKDLITTEGLVLIFFFFFFFFLQVELQQLHIQMHIQENVECVLYNLLNFQKHYRTVSILALLEQDRNR